jgi:hypothetical protein
MKQKTDTSENKIPVHTRLGLRLLQILLVVLALMLVKRCVYLYLDNRMTDQRIQTEYFEKGFANGLNRSRGMVKKPDPQFKNYALEKAYRDGYRQGWDKGRETVKSQ